MPNKTAQLSQKIRQFYQWWWTNFSFWLPKAVQTYFGKLQPIFLDIFYSEDDQLSCFYRINEEEHQFKINFDSRDELTTAIEKNPPLKNAIIRLFLPQKLVIFREITLPKVNDEELRTLIEYQIESLTPFKSEDIYFNTVIIEEHIEHINAVLFILQKDIVNTINNRLHLLDIQADFYMSEQFKKDFPACDKKYNLLPISHTDNSFKKRNVFYTAIFGLLISIIAFPFIADTYSLNVIDNNIAELQRINKQININESKISQYLEKYNQLNTIYTQYHYPRSVINEITHSMDPKSWITYMQVTGTKIDLQGFTENSASLLQLFENTSEFKKVHFLSPTSKDKTLNMEKFHLSMEFEN